MGGRPRNSAKKCYFYCGETLTFTTQAVSKCTAEGHRAHPPGVRLSPPPPPGPPIFPSRHYPYQTLAPPARRPPSLDPEGLGRPARAGLCRICPFWVSHQARLKVYTGRTTAHPACQGTPGERKPAEQRGSGAGGPGAVSSSTAVPTGGPILRAPLDSCGSGLERTGGPHMHLLSGPATPRRHTDMPLGSAAAAKARHSGSKQKRQVNSGEAAVVRSAPCFPEQAPCPCGPLHAHARSVPCPQQASLLIPHSPRCTRL